MHSALPAREEQAAPIPEAGRPRRFRSRRFNTAEARRTALILLGVLLFLAVYLAPALPEAVDPQGRLVVLSREGRAALALFLLAAVWWIFEVVPIGVTGITVGLVQVLFHIREPAVALSNFFNPAIGFIFASLIMGKSLSKSGLTQRLAYHMLAWAGDRTSMIYLGSFSMIAVLTLVMAHTAAAATIFPLLMAIHSLYQEDGQPTRFGKGLFIGMAFAAGAGSVVTMLGAARGVVAADLFRGMVGRDVSFFQFSYYLLPVGWGMLILLWLLVMAVFKPERKTIPGLKARAQDLACRLGPMSRPEILTVLIVVSTIVLLCLHAFIPRWQTLDRTGIMLAAALTFFLFKILSLQDLEEIPWNILLLFGGAISAGFCLWQTGAANWLAVQWLAAFHQAPGFVFILSVGCFILVITNVIVNVAALAFTLPVALAIAPYLGVAPEAVFFTCLAASGMPFLLLIGAAPNAIAFESRQFTAVEFLKIGLPATLILLAVLSLFVALFWPLMGLEVMVKP